MFVNREHVLVERALGQAGTTTEEASPTTSDAPYFTSGSNDSSDSNSPDLTKTALEWAFAIAALLIVMFITVWRYSRIRRRNALRAGRTTRESFGRSFPLPRTTGLPRGRTLSASSMARNMIAVHPSEEALFYPPSLVHGRYPVTLEPEAAHIAPNGARSGRRGRRAATGADIDSGGRRAGGRPDGEESDGDWDDKEVLPAYQSVAVGGPPQYAMDPNAPHGPFIITMPEPILGSSDNLSSSRTDNSVERNASTDVTSGGDAHGTSLRDMPTISSAGTNSDRQGALRR